MGSNNSSDESKHLVTKPNIKYYDPYESVKRYLILRPSSMDNQITSLLSDLETTTEAGYNIYRHEGIAIWDVVGGTDIRDYIYHKLIMKRNYHHAVIIIPKDEDVKETLKHIQFTHLNIPTTLLSQNGIAPYTSYYNMKYLEIDISDITNYFKLISLV